MKRIPGNSFSRENMIRDSLLFNNGAALAGAVFSLQASFFHVSDFHHIRGIFHRIGSRNADASDFIMMMSGESSPETNES
jgi:hypothetical protein